MMKNKSLVDFLNQTVSNCAVMYIKLHRYHWFVQGENFFKLHEVFEEMYDSFAVALDNIAERILMIDGKPFATMKKFLKETTLNEANADDKPNEMIEQLIEDYEQLISEIQEDGISLAEEQKDEPTVDMLIEFQGKLQQYVWMLKAYVAYE